MTDVLPAGVILLGPPTVTELTPSAVPLIASFNAGIGPSGAVLWAGTLTPGGAVQIQFSVRVRECINLLVNRAVALNTNGSQVAAITESAVNCQPVTAADHADQGGCGPGLDAGSLQRRNLARPVGDLPPDPQRDGRPVTHCAHERQHPARAGGDGGECQQRPRHYHRCRSDCGVGRRARPGNVAGDDQDRRADYRTGAV